MNLEHITEDGVRYAVSSSRVGRQWKVKGRLHRLAGPAIEYRDGVRSFYVDAQRVECTSTDDPEFKRAVLAYLMKETKCSS